MAKARSKRVPKIPSLHPNQRHPAATRTHHTHEERRAFGRSRRSHAHRVGQAQLVLPPNREILPLLLEANRGRIPELMPIKWGRMSESPFVFFRGAAPLMARDLATTPVTGLVVQLCGDAHVRNLGAYAAPDGHLVFDINDFDETILGPWEWDVKRLVTSLVLAGREAGDSDKRCEVAVLELLERYRDSMDEFAEMPVVELARYQVRRGLEGGAVGAILSRAEKATPLRTLKKLTAERRGSHRFVARPPLLFRIPDAQAMRVLAALANYRDTLGPDRQHVLDEYQPTDVAFKVVGTGSVGTRDYVVLLFGNGPGDPLFLQIKEEPPSCYTPVLPDAPRYEHQGKRVCDGQHRIQALTDPFLGYTSLDGRHYLVRQLSDHKASIDVGEMSGAGLREYGLVCGEILARGHARTGDAAAISGYCGETDKLDRALAAFAIAYADQCESDHQVFLKAIKAGKIKAVAGV
jgi:uncharacterized protein (DUF2252 family)